MPKEYIESIVRFRRLRMKPALRAMISETRLSTQDLISPLFVVPGNGIRTEVSSMPGVFQLSIDYLLRECAEIKNLGIPAVILFGVPESKDEMGTGAYLTDGIVQKAIQAIKKEIPELVVIADICLCEYTSHGHCGLLKGDEILNDESVVLLTQMANRMAEVGADMIAPSDMFDGRVAAIRKSLDQAGFLHTPIMSYAAKYASGFYSPFRDAAQSRPVSGDRRSHQMDFANSDEALREVEQDIREGADIVMIKPALPCLDIIRRVKDQFHYPTAAFQVSGEYSMIKAAAQKGWIDENQIIYETLLSIKRAGADLILTYFAKQMAEQIRRSR